MTKFAVALAAVAAMVLGFGGVASAYPPGGANVTATPSPTLAVELAARDRRRPGQEGGFPAKASHMPNDLDIGVLHDFVEVILRPAQAPTDAA